MKAHTIPKIIHYVWFGQQPKSNLILRCISSWKENCPDYEIREWSEATFDVHSHAFTEKMYARKKWAFVADYVRLHALYTEGGVYLDTDMLLLQKIDELLPTELLLGKESERYISCGMIGAIPHHPFIKNFMEYYDGVHKLSDIRPNPTILTELFEKEKPGDCIILPPHSFYPYTAHNIKEFKGQALPSSVYGVHLWNYSWGSPLNRFFLKIGVHRVGVRVAETLRIKKLLKKILRIT